MIKQTILIIALLILLPSAQAYAEKRLKPTELIIEDCEQVSRPLWDSGITSKMVDGSINFNTCLEAQIEIHLNEILTVKDAKEAIALIEEATGKIRKASYIIHNQRKSCFLY